MKAKLENPKAFSEVISIISELVTEVKIKVNEDGLSIIAIDPANVALVSFILPKASFSQFEVTKEEILGVNLDSLRGILKRSSLGRRNNRSRCYVFLDCCRNCIYKS